MPSLNRKRQIMEKFMVKCPECGDDHLPNEVQTLNIEEDIQGRDVIEFVCPFNGVTTKSFVFQVNRRM